MVSNILSLAPRYAAGFLKSWELAELPLPQRNRKMRRKGD